MIRKIFITKNLLTIIFVLFFTSIFLSGNVLIAVAESIAIAAV